jgi:transcriptional regulator with XRE-family HTH domain
MDDLYRIAAQELLRAIRGQRSQVAFARRLGYRANPLTDWENGRRTPTMREALRAAVIAGLPVTEAFHRFAPIAPPSVNDSLHVHRWLDSLRGSLSVADLARRSGHSRYAVRRWLAGEAEPKVHDFLSMVAALTGRVHEWVGALVPIEQVPSLEGSHRQLVRARRLALDSPWSEAVLRVLETTGYAEREGSTAAYVAQVLGLDDEHVSEVLGALRGVGVLRPQGEGYALAEPLSVDTSGAQLAELQRLRAHWAKVAQARVCEGHSSDWFAYNVISVSRADSKRIEERLRAAYREVRSIVAQSTPCEVASLLTLQMVRWGEPT